MMKVYQPLCPDITFRLVADISPDTLEESEESTPSSSSSSSSSEDEEGKMKIFDEASDTSRENNNRFTTTTSSASATASPGKTSKEIYTQGRFSNGTSSPSVACTSRSSSPSSQPSTSSALELDPEEDGAELVCDVEEEKCQEELNSNLSALDCTTRIAGPTSDKEEGVVQEERYRGNSATLVQGTKRCSDDLPDVCISHQPPHFYLDPESTNAVVNATAANDDDSDAESIEDISISQNVPNCPPPLPAFPVSPAPHRRGRMGAAAEVTGGASGSSSDSDGAVAVKARMQLDIHRPLTKYHGHYTLACDVTPSPMQENVTMANTLAVVSASSATTPSALASNTSNSCNNSSIIKVPRRPRKLPEIPRKHQGMATVSSCMTRSIFDEIQEALVREASVDEPFEAPAISTSDVDAAQQYPFIHKHMGHLFDKKRLLIGYATSPAKSSRSRHTSSSSSSVASEAGPPPAKPCRSRNVSGSSVTSEAGAAASLEEEVSFAQAQAVSRPLSEISSASATVTCSQQRRRKNSDGDGSRRHSSSSMSTPYHDLEVTHRGMHRFIPRHADEVQVGIGDPIHVIKEYDDLWCEGVNLRSGERGIFPAMYANDLKFLEDSDGDEEHWKFTMRFLGAVEVTSSSGDFALCQAINKVAQQGRNVKTASLCTLEINQYGIRMLDKSKEGHESKKFTNFFALKNISFCGTHPSNNRYFAFITKHPREARFACHVFHSDRSTHRARDALGNAFKRFYQEYMAFTHPTEDIWIE
ncbi:pneumococcal serine-rich repeat protein-like isoform X2 [Littorina saxatilis]|uniref:pneumococcal serine-rich repeat protein-like isoform X2 n=1 Tax=Littorina saxatilis TaxID=31220 RepID=UPI0038B41F90